MTVDGQRVAGDEKFRMALVRALAARDLSAAGLGRLLDLSQSAVSQWTSGRTLPSPDYIFATERCLMLPPGTLSRHLGYIPATLDGQARKLARHDVITAIELDDRLGDVGKRMLIAAYKEWMR